jgi:hypothetical protein
MQESESLSSSRIQADSTVCEEGVASAWRAFCFSLEGFAGNFGRVEDRHEHMAKKLCRHSPLSKKIRLPCHDRLPAPSPLVFLSFPGRVSASGELVKSPSVFKKQF